MASVAHIGVRFRRLVHLLVVLTTAAMLAAPLLLGPATQVVLRALGGGEEHHCACGMRPGTCGCPECAALEKQRRDDRVPRPYAVLRSSCDDGERLVGSSALPRAVSPVTAALPPVPALRREIVVAEEPDRSCARARPPTPPPRSVA